MTNRGGFNNPNRYNTVDGNGLQTSEKLGIDDTDDYFNENHTKNYTEFVFDLFESAPRYGKQHNLMFSVRYFLFAYLLIFIFI